MTNADVVWRLLARVEELERELETLAKAGEQKEAKD